MGGAPGFSGKRAFYRGDLQAAANLYGRAIQLVTGEDYVRLKLLPAYAEVMMELGDFQSARQAVTKPSSEPSRPVFQR